MLKEWSARLNQWTKVWVRVVVLLVVVEFHELHSVVLTLIYPLFNLREMRRSFFEPSDLSSGRNQKIIISTEDKGHRKDKTTPLLFSPIYSHGAVGLTYQCNKRFHSNLAFGRGSMKYELWHLPFTLFSFIPGAWRWRAIRSISDSKSIHSYQLERKRKPRYVVV